MLLLLFRSLQEYNVNLTVYDPWANPQVVKHEYGIEVINELPKKKYDAVVLAVAHKEFSDMNMAFLFEQEYVLFDVKGMCRKELIDGRL